MTVANSFHELFRGLEKAHGTYLVTDARPEGEKQEGVGKTVLKPVTNDLWQTHLDGKTRIGVVPINDESMCYFGAIDIDIYPLNLVEVCKIIHKVQLPLNPCRSKSGGLHAYLFTNEAVPAALLGRKLKEFAALIGYSKIRDKKGDEKDVDIYPRQDTVLSERGDIGNWINMPYFGGEDTLCYGMDSLAKPLTPLDFLAKANGNKVTRKWLEQWVISKSDEFKDGPPCLQALFRLGLGEGQRNNGLLNVATYYHRKDPSKVKKAVVEMNEKMCKPPLGVGEVSILSESTGRKKYLYACSKHPLRGHCDQGLCRTRRYGIAEVTGSLVFAGIRKYDAEPPVWFVNIAGMGALELTTESLQSQVLFQKRCMESLNMMPPFVSQKIWTATVQELMLGVDIIEAPPEATPAGRLIEHLDKFLSGRNVAKSKEELLMGKIWLEDKERMYYFRMQDFIYFLDRTHYKELKPSQVASVINQHGGGHQFFNINRRGTNCMKFPSREQVDAPIPLPTIKEKDPF